jgi:hypothetical protein
MRPAPNSAWRFSTCSIERTTTTPRHVFVGSFDQITPPATAGRPRLGFGESRSTQLGLRLIFLIQAAPALRRQLRRAPYRVQRYHSGSHAGPRHYSRFRWLFGTAAASGAKATGLRRSVACFNRFDGGGAATLSTVAVGGMSFDLALHVTPAPSLGNAWEIRPRCFATALRAGQCHAVTF